MTSNHINAIDFADANIVAQTLNTVKGQKIEEVFYCIVNDQDKPFKFPGFHLCDLAVLIKLSNDQWLNWIWVEGGRYLPGEINITTMNISSKLSDEFTEIIDVSNSEEWSKFIGKEIEIIEFKTIINGGNKHISDLKLTIEDDSVTICAIDEPNMNKLPKLDGLPYSANWTIIVFDDEILKAHHRIIK